MQSLAALFVLGSWWLGTLVVLWAVWLPRHTFRWSLVIASFAAFAGAAGLAWSSQTATPAAAYVAFGSAMLVWSWHEVGFLLGAVTGPRRLPCPPGASGWARFRDATLVVIHHEIALAATLGLIVALTHRAPNQVGVATFMVLWAMRLSAKFNVFLGVRNVSEDFVPSHLRYILTYFRQARMNPLMPFSVAVGSVVTVALARGALSERASAFDLVASALVAALMAIAVLEHVLLNLPVPDAQLWKWAIRRRVIDAPLHEVTHADPDAVP
jgi:putative photosynthetic complex assembly protein 2